MTRGLEHLAFDVYDDVFTAGLSVAGMDLEDPHPSLGGWAPWASGSNPESPRMSIMDPSLIVISRRSGDRL
jgi:hypothetical protein